MRIEFVGVLVKRERIEQGQPSGQRCVSSASRPRGAGSVRGVATLQVQQFFVGERADQLHHVGMNALARRARESLD